LNVQGAVSDCSGAKNLQDYMTGNLIRRNFRLLGPMLIFAYGIQNF
jgi:hypothetical protein